MRKLSKQELKDILDKHSKWLRDKEGGERADLSGANLRNADLRNAYLRNAYLRNADLRNADLSGANLRNANLSGANLSSANLYGANLIGANLRNAYLHNANLYGANLRSTNLNNTQYENSVIVTFQYQKHTAYYFGLDEITIGCEKHSIDKWLANFEEIGKTQNYTDEQIKKYGRFIKSCARDFKSKQKGKK